MFDALCPMKTGAWEAAEALIAGFDMYEPTPQFCDPGRGCYEVHELRRRAGALIKAIEGKS